MGILEKISKGLLLFISVVCVYASPAAFTGAVFLSFALMPVAGVMAIYGHIYFAIIMLLLSSIAIMISAISDVLFISVHNALFTLVPVILGYGGLALGLYKLKKNVPVT